MVASSTLSRLNLLLATFLFIFKVSDCDVKTNSTFSHTAGCAYPRQYEGYRLTSNYLAEQDNFVAVDCDLQLEYERSRLQKAAVYSIKDLKAEKFYFFTPGSCFWSELKTDLMESSCQVPEAAVHNGELFLGGKLRDKWSRLQGPFKYNRVEVTTRVTIDQDGERGCLPFLSRLMKGGTVISGSLFYEVRGGISDPSIFHFDASSCEKIESR